VLDVLCFEGEENLSEPFRYTIEFTSSDKAITPQQDLFSCIKRHALYLPSIAFGHATARRCFLLIRSPKLFVRTGFPVRRFCCRVPGSTQSAQPCALLGSLSTGNSDGRTEHPATSYNHAPVTDDGCG
jgi:hypothetical protein